MLYCKYNVDFKIDKFPYEIIQLDEARNDKIKKDYEGNMDHYLLVGPKKYYLYESYKSLGPIFYNYPIKSDDVWLFGYPRSGTTLMQEMIWLICNDLNFEKASGTIVDLRFHFLEHGSIYPINNEKANDEKISKIIETVNIPNWKILLEQKERRFIKTHLPISLVNPNIFKSGCKVIYIVRNPKDVIVSNFHFIKSMKFIGFKENFEEFWEYFKQNLCLWCPYFEHIKEGWENRHNPNFLFLYYEEIVQDMKKAIKKVATFFGKSLNDQELYKLETHLKIENFQKNNSVNNNHLREAGVMDNNDYAFIRRGKINGWKDYFTDKINAEIDTWIKENMKGCDLKFFE